MESHEMTFVVFAANGAIASEVARQASAAGASVYVSSRDESALMSLRDEIEAAGGVASAEVVDATDGDAVDAYLDRIAAKGAIGAVFNGIGLRAAEAHYARPSATLPFDRFLAPLETIVGSTFLTSRAAGRHMTAAGKGSIVTLSASLSGLALPFMAGISAACGAIEAMTRSLAAEYGGAGVRVNCVRADAMPETRTIQETSANMMETLRMVAGDAGNAPPMPDNLLRRPISTSDTAAAVVHLASNASRSITAQVVNVCGGHLVG